MCTLIDGIERQWVKRSVVTRYQDDGLFYEVPPPSYTHTCHAPKHTHPAHTELPTTRFVRYSRSSHQCPAH